MTRVVNRRQSTNSTTQVYSADDAANWRDGAPGFVGAGLDELAVRAQGIERSKSLYLTQAGAVQSLAVLPASSGIAYFNYLGFFEYSLVWDWILFHVRTAGVGTQTAEVGFFTTPGYPAKAGQTLTCVAANGTLSALTGTGNMSNTVAMGYTNDPGIHLWDGIRTAMSVTQPTMIATGDDLGAGTLLLTSAGASAFAVANQYSGGLPTTAITGFCPALGALATP